MLVVAASKADFLQQSELETWKGRLDGVASRRDAFDRGGPLVARLDRCNRGSLGGIVDSDERDRRVGNDGAARIDDRDD